ncbi:ATPase domain predominantly from Archaea [uncultured archaeon]|nr:ATPase domain predominantly from Archaea [uncultured archaeon]
MIMFRKFIDRDEELEYLNREFKSENFSFTVIYGRRRVGKTEMITNFLKDKPNIYFLADKRGTKPNLQRFRKKSAEFFKDYEPNLETFDEVFEYIRTKWNGEQKLVIVIDEFSYLAQMDDSVPSVFQLIADEILKKSAIHLVLCGSSISMMEKSALAQSSPLYGRRTGQILLKPMLFRHVREFFPELPLDEIVNIYGAAGGIPFYLLFFDPMDSFYENLMKEFFAKEAVLYAEGEFLLREELKEPATFMNILFAISKGATRPGEIASKSYLEAKDLPYYMDTILKLGFVKKEHPVLEKPTTKKTIYRIEDNFLRFWFRYVLSHRDEIEQGDKKPAIDDLKKNYGHYLGETFEQIGKEMLIYLNSIEKLPFRFQKLGRQWGKIPMAEKGRNDYEIDLVAVNNDTREIFFCECKYEKGKVDTDVYFKLLEKAGFVKWYPERKEHFGIISRSGFTERMIDEAKKKGILLLRLEDYIS